MKVLLMICMCCEIQSSSVVTSSMVLPSSGYSFNWMAGKSEFKADWFLAMDWPQNSAPDDSHVNPDVVGAYFLQPRYRAQPVALSGIYSALGPYTASAVYAVNIDAIAD